MHLEELERRSAVLVQAALAARAQGSKADIPDPVAMRADFDRWLMSPDPNGDVDPAMMVKMRALGVSRGR